MFLREQKLTYYFLAILLVLLQVILPLIHAHTSGTDYQNNEKGIHVHFQHSKNPSLDHLPVIQTRDDLSSVVTVPSGNKPDELLVPAAIICILLVIAVLIQFVSTKVIWLNAIFITPFSPPYLLLPLRATPL
jgi:preprotein translocase subunit SecG